MCSPEPSAKDIPCLRTGLLSDDPYTRRQAAIELQTLGGTGRGLLPELEASACDTNADVRIFVVGAIGTIAPERQADVVDVLIDALENPDLLQAALVQLGHFRAVADRVAPALGAALLDTRGFQRTVVASTLARLGPPGAAELSARLNAADPDLRRLAARALGRSGVSSQDVLAALNHALNDKDESVRQAAERSIAKLRTSQIAGHIVAFRPKDLVGTEPRLYRDVFLFQRLGSSPALIKLVHDHVGRSGIDASALKSPAALHLAVRRDSTCDQTYQRIATDANEEGAGGLVFVSRFASLEPEGQARLECYVAPEGTDPITDTGSVGADDSADIAR